MKTILIVDDDQLVLEGTQTYLETKGFTTLGAKDGVEALQTIKDNHVDLAVIDIFMPNKGGFETISSLKNDLPIIAMSGVSAHRFEPLEFAESLGAQASLTKPFYPHDLLSAIRDLLEVESV
ncbi:MAG: response regulator [Methylocystaceae bacterium]|nr:response regulator [Methylocystaceae bacterium]